MVIWFFELSNIRIFVRKLGTLENVISSMKIEELAKK